MKKPHLLYLAWGFPPAAKSCTYRKLATANSFKRAGWDVTVITLNEDAWKREHGLDLSLMELVDEGIEQIRLPLYREDLDTDIRTYSRLRAQRPKEWLKRLRKADVKDFPELVYGRWRKPLEDAVREAHARKPADLVLTSAAPYTFFAPALDLHEQDGVPFVLDYRDAWAIDILNDKPAWEQNSRQGVIEARLMETMDEAWFVNSPIRDAYADLYPDRAGDLHVVRNGSDVALGTDRIALRVPNPDEGLTFGYLGTVTFKPAITRMLCEAWRLASETDETIAKSRFEFRGHIGAGAARGSTSHSKIISDFEPWGASYGGPVAKGDTAAVYESWDALVLCLVGGKYVTSGKVYDYVSTGLPVMSAHEKEHAATEILRDYPLWQPNESMTVEGLAQAFIDTAKMALAASTQAREDAREYAHRFERYAQIAPAVRRLTEQFADTDSATADQGA